MMNYVELNAAHIKAMRGICHNSTDFEWEDSDILKYCAGELPRIRHFSMKADVREKESALENEYRKYKFFATSPADFLKSIETKLNDLYSVDKYWSGLHLSQVEDVIRLQKFCLISGEGGIGKSFFVKCLEEELTKNKTKHLCLYGKFCKDVDIINFEEIKHLGLTEEIVFVFDALNEIDESNQLKLLNKLHDMKKVRGVRIIVSYRNHTVNTDILEKYQKLSEFQYEFPGVSFESVLEWLQKEAIVDINEYVDVIYSNNPLLLCQLPYILPDKKEKNNISRQTYIYEQFIKRVLDRDTWLKTKVLAKFLYDNNKKYFTIEELTSLVCEPLTYIFRMQQQGFVHRIRSDDVETYSFSIDTMSDFLISRNLLDDLKDKDTEDIIKIINDKLESFYSINRETVILLIFDKLAPDFATIREILYATDLINNMTYDSLTKMHFSESDIACFLKEFKVANNAELILHFAGFINKPFNCTNYLNDYYLKYPEKQSIELSRQLSGKYIYGMLLGRLKNIIYFTAKCEITLERARENLYTSIWCSAACNPDIRNISTKLLYETLEKHPCLIEETVELFPKIHDCYIQESIIAVLSSLPERDSVVCLFNSILASYDFTMARSIKRMSSYLKTPYSYIELRKQNLLKSENDNISEDFTSYLHKVNLMEKELLPFRFWGENRIETSTKFLQEDKDIIKKFNADLASKFACVETGVCNGTMTFQKKVEKWMGVTYMGSVIDDKTFLSSLESVFKIVFAKYGLPFEYEAYLALREQDFLYSLLRKCIDISSDLFMGSLMCNYYSSEFQTFNDVTNSIGYDIYDPLRYREDINLCCPVSVYQSQIEKMGDYVLTHLEYPSEKDEAWWKDLEITKRNLLHLLQPIKHNGVEWLLISGRVMMMDKLDTDAWKDVYDIYICSSSEETIKGDDEDRYLTIETDEYCGNLSEYYQSKQKPWLCKSVKSIAYSSGLFDDTRLLLPPVDIIKALNLRLNLTDMCWYNTSGERIICCNNNKSSYYQDNISGTIFIRKDSFEELCKIKSIKIFAFAEKYIRNRGFCDETDYHFEIIDNKIVKMFSNGTSERASRYERRQSQCKKCPYGFNERSKKSDLRKFLKKLKMDYGY